MKFIYSQVPEGNPQVCKDCFIPFEFVVYLDVESPTPADSAGSEMTIQANGHLGVAT